jgi:hypothetical protein
LKPAVTGRSQLGRFNEAFRLRAGPWLYEPTDVLPGGAPVFVKKAAPAPGLYELAGGRVLAMNERNKSTGRDGAPGHTVVRSPDGKPVWKYETSYSGVSGLFLPPWSPGYVTNEFGVIGHETETRGDLGEFFVTAGGTCGPPTACSRGTCCGTSSTRGAATSTRSATGAAGPN